MIILTCGHTTDDFNKAHHVFTKSYSREDLPAVSYSVVCDRCKEQYQRDNILFSDEHEADRWLSEQDSQ